MIELVVLDSLSMLFDLHDFFVLQVLRDVPKARREIELHCRASICEQIVRIIDVYENMYAGHKCLLVVMEW